MKLLNPGRSSTTTRLAFVVRLLVDHAWTIPELVVEAQLANSTVRAIIRALRAQGLIYVSGWTEDRYGRQLSPEFRFGPEKEDVRRRPPQNHAQRAAARTARMQALRLNRRMAGLDKLRKVA